MKTADTTHLCGPASFAIVQAVRKYEPDMTVMATSGRAGARRFIHDSVAETAVRGTQTPVFLVRADSAGRRAHRRDVVSFHGGRQKQEALARLSERRP
jgi:hypothetical protein